MMVVSVLGRRMLVPQATSKASNHKISCSRKVAKGAVMRMTIIIIMMRIIIMPMMMIINMPMMIIIMPMMITILGQQEGCKARGKVL